MEIEDLFPFPALRDRACFNCGIIKLFIDFLIYGCPNCEKYLLFQNSIDRVAVFSSPSFQDMFVIPNGCTNWKTRLKPVERFVFGIYASKVYGRIPSRYVCELDERSGDANITGEHCL